MASSNNDGQAAYFPIRVVSQQTGVNAITLRAWERRYNLLSPKRTAKGHRLYSDGDIRLIKQVVGLLNRGIPISQAQAMLNENSIETAPLKVNSAEQTSQWQHYRETLRQALHDFDEQILDAVFEEATRYFPVDITLRFLLIPIYNQLKDQCQAELGKARLAFYSAFLQARLATRLYDNSNVASQQQAAIAITNFSQKDEVSLLLMAVLLKQLGLRPHYFSGFLNGSHITELVTSGPWQACLVQMTESAEPAQFRQLQQAAIESGKPVFVTGLPSTMNDTLTLHNLIPVAKDIQESALTVRDLLTGIPA